MDFFGDPAGILHLQFDETSRGGIIILWVNNSSPEHIALRVDICPGEMTCPGKCSLIRASSLYMKQAEVPGSVFFRR
jgi:hypothetical protein